MSINFWQQKKKEAEGKNLPIFCLAPMADVTDSAFRHTIAKSSKNEKNVNWDYITWTEFVSADGLILAKAEGKKKLLKDLEFTEIERPIVAQFFTSKPLIMQEIAEQAVLWGFDGIDINMGCPDKSIEKQGAGASLIKNKELAKEIILSAKIGAENGALKKWGNKEMAIPVSVKTRIGYNSDELEIWLPELLSVNPSVITLHARTRKEMSKVPANWDRIKRAVEIRDSLQKEINKDSRTLIFGNGDIKNIEDGILLSRQTGCDGIMLGRAIFGNPFLFTQKNITEKEQLLALVDHIRLFEKNLGDIKSFAVMKKHFKSYLLKVENSKELKDLLLSSNDAEEAINLILAFVSKMI